MSDDIFTKMVNHPLIQGQWKEPKVGDWTNWGVVIGVQHEKDTIKVCNRNGYCSIEYIRHDRAIWSDARKIIWHPSQKDLQEMLGYNLTMPDALQILIGKFYFFSADPVAFALDDWKAHTEYLSLFTSIQQLWLAFIMWELHGQRWDSVGERWVERKEKGDEG